MSAVVEIVFKKGVLFDINIGRWSALHQMKTNDLLLEKLNRKVIYPGHKKLLPEDVAFPLVQIEGKIRRFVEKKSMNFFVGGGVFVNLKALPALLEGLKPLKEEYEKRAHDLYLAFDTVKEKQIQVLDEEARKIAVQNGLYEQSTPLSDREVLKNWLKEQHKQHLELYPPKDKLLAKYYVSWTMFRVAPMNDMGAALVSDLEVEIMKQQADEFEKKTKLWVKEKAAEMHKKLGEAALAAQKTLADNGKLNPKNLKPLFAAFEEFAAVDFGGSAFSKVIEDVKATYLPKGSDAADFKSVAEAVNSNADGFGQLLDQLSGLAVDEVAEKAGLTSIANTEFKRVVEV